MITKILACLAVLGGIAGLILGYVDTKTGLAMVYAGLAVFGLRQSITPITGGRGAW